MNLYSQGLKTSSLNKYDRRSNPQTSAKAHLVLKILCPTWETGQLHVHRI